MKVTEHPERRGGEIPYTLHLSQGEAVPKLGSKFELPNGRLIFVEKTIEKGGCDTVVMGSYYRGVADLNPIHSTR